MAMPGFKRVANRLLFWVLGLSAIIFTGFAGVSYELAKGLIEQQAQSRAQLAVDNTVQKIDGLLNKVGQNVNTAEQILGSSAFTDADLLEVLHNFVISNPDAYGMAIAVEPDIMSNGMPFAPYWYKSGDSYEYADLADPAYDYQQKPWYRDAIDSGEPVWSEPYFDEGGGQIAMVTYSVPVRTASSDKVVGVVTADITLDSLHTLVSGIALGQEGFGYILSQQGNLISHTDTSLRMQAVESLPMWQQQNPEWVELIGSIRSGRSGHGSIPCEVGLNQICWYSFQPLPRTDWAIIVIIPMEQVEQAMTSLGERMLPLSFIALLILGVVVLMVSRRLTQPVNALATVTRRVAEGDLDAPIPNFGLSDEIGSLAENFDRMQGSLKAHIAQLTEETARRERVESELSIAATIQAQMLPDGGRSIFSTGNIDFAAITQPARQIGGDFYLYQPLANGQLFFLVGDVSDKGVPAALFMARTVAEVNALVHGDVDPSALLAALNDKLCQDNEHCMFVTAIAGVLNTQTGECTYASAGHSAPLLIDGRLSQLRITSGAAMGLMEHNSYSNHTVSLGPKAVLLIFTDGIDEAMNEQNTEFGLKGIFNSLQQLDRHHPTFIVDNLLRQVMSYQKDIQFDDITILALGRKGGS